jgi:hypothetical protein
MLIKKAQKSQISTVATEVLTLVKVLLARLCQVCSQLQQMLEPGLKVNLLVVEKLIQASTLVVDLIRTVMIGGTVLRPSGKIANKGAGQQYELPKRFKGEEKLLTEVTPELLVMARKSLTIPQSPQRFLNPLNLRKVRSFCIQWCRWS